MTTILKHRLMQAILFTVTLCVSLPVYAGVTDDISRSVKSFMHDAGQMVISGGIIILAVMGLIVGIATVFSLFMMVRR